MKKITPKSKMEDVAASVVEHLNKKGLSTTMVGGSVVSIYSNNQYQSRDIDFISPDDHRKITSAMIELGFEKRGKDFIHPNTEISVEFPSGPLALGDEIPVEPEGEITIKGVSIQLLSPTQSIMDRLASFFYFQDRQCLDQAVMIYHSQKNAVSLQRIETWSKKEQQKDKFEIFLNRIKS